MKFNPKETLIKTFGSTHWLCFIVEPKDVDSIQKVINNEHTVSVDKIKKSRSLSANAYLWILLDKLSTAITVPKGDLYIKMIKQYGIFDSFIVKKEIYDHVYKSWDTNNTNVTHEESLCDVINTFTSKGIDYVEFNGHYGTSCYDPSQFSRLLEGLVSDCKLQSIETETTEKLKAMMEEYERRYGEK